MSTVFKNPDIYVYIFAFFSFKEIKYANMRVNDVNVTVIHKSQNWNRIGSVRFSDIAVALRNFCYLACF